MLFFRNTRIRFYATLASLSLIAVGVFFIFSGIGHTYTEALMSYTAQSVWDRIFNRESAYVLTESMPTKLRIPTLDIEASFVTLGVTETNEIEIPETYTDVGWYKYGPTPGELGPAIVLGHVDSKNGPGVFFYLGQLNPGDTIEIERDDGTTAEFRVDALERYDQEDFPTSLVYGDIKYAGLRLITCSGSYDREQKRYDRNLVVYASLVEPQPTEAAE